jgi:hypothetical protein
MTSMRCLCGRELARERDLSRNAAGQLDTAKAEVSLPTKDCPPMSGLA